MRVKPKCTLHYSTYKLFIGQVSTVYTHKTEVQNPTYTCDFTVGQPTWDIACNHQRIHSTPTLKTDLSYHVNVSHVSPPNHLLQPSANVHTVAIATPLYRGSKHSFICRRHVLLPLPNDNLPFSVEVRVMDPIRGATRHVIISQLFTRCQMPVHCHCVDTALELCTGRTSITFTIIIFPNCIAKLETAVCSKAIHLC